MSSRGIVTVTWRSQRCVVLHLLVQASSLLDPDRCVGRGASFEAWSPEEDADRLGTPDVADAAPPARARGGARP